MRSWLRWWRKTSSASGTQGTERTVDELREKMAKIAPGGVLQLTEVELAAMKRADWKDPYWRKGDPTTLNDPRWPDRGPDRRTPPNDEDHR